MHNYTLIEYMGFIAQIIETAAVLGWIAFYIRKLKQNDRTRTTKTKRN